MELSKLEVLVYPCHIPIPYINSVYSVSDDLRFIINEEFHCINMVLFHSCVVHDSIVYNIKHCIDTFYITGCVDQLAKASDTAVGHGFEPRTYHYHRSKIKCRIYLLIYLCIN